MHWMSNRERGRRMLALLLDQLSQRTTIAALINALVLLVGHSIAPEKVDALALLLSVADSVILAMVQEAGAPALEHGPPPPVDGGHPCDDHADEEHAS